MNDLKRLQLTDGRAMYHLMRVALEPWATFTDKQWNHVKAIFHPRRYRASEDVICPGMQTEQIIFVCRGLLRVYRYDLEGKEWDTEFIAPNNWLGFYAGYHLGYATRFGVRALEETLVLRASYAELAALYDRHPKFERLGRKLSEYLLIRRELREQNMLEENVVDRYLDFLEQYPGLAETLPKKRLASYLGISLPLLWRVQSEVAKR